MFIEEVLL